MEQHPGRRNEISSTATNGVVLCCYLFQARSYRKLFSVPLRK
jgi:hypothetical protein